MSDGNVAAEQLRLFIERIERLEEEKKGIADDIKDVYLEAKANGYDVKTMRSIVRLRKMERNARMEADRKSTRLNSSHYCADRMPSSASKKKTDYIKNII